MLDVTGKQVLVTGGTGSLGSVLVRRLMSGAHGTPSRVIVFSRDEAKQHAMKIAYQTHRNGSGHPKSAPLRFQLGDVRDYSSLVAALRGTDIVFHVAALKQVPNCEYAPHQAVMTNILGAANLVRAIADTAPQVELVVGVSTDKACEPVNVMGMTKAIQERVLIEGNLECRGTRFVCVRYGNVIASTGSVVPLFVRQIQEGGPLTLTHTQMTRFLISLDRAGDSIFAAADTALPGETYVPRIPAARVVDIAHVLMNGRDIPILHLGIRPGEKIHEVLVSETECPRTREHHGHYVISPILPELCEHPPLVPALSEPYTSQNVTCDIEMLAELLHDCIPGLPTRQLAFAG